MVYQSLKASEILKENGISTTVKNMHTVKPLDTQSIDELINHRLIVTVDIEGSELSLLKGAQKVIKRNKPKLVICVYHKPEDLYEIPLYIQALCSDYKIYIRHSSPIFMETVCYAYV